MITVLTCAWQKGWTLSCTANSSKALDPCITFISLHAVTYQYLQTASMAILAPLCQRYMLGGSVSPLISTSRGCLPSLMHIFSITLVTLCLATIELNKFHATPTQTIKKAPRDASLVHVKEAASITVLRNMGESSTLSNTGMNSLYGL